MLTQERLKEVVDYNFSTGIFTWKINIANHIPSGKVAGSMNCRGYIDIKIDGKKYQAHRLAWLYVCGAWPINEIDHKNTIKHHNWIENLRDITKRENMQNRIIAQSRNKIGILGVSKISNIIHSHSKKYRSEIRVEGKRIYLGSFLTAEEAHQAYLKAKRIYHAGCTI